MRRAREGNESQQDTERNMPTLGQVAEEARFASLRELLQQVAETPVDQLLHESTEGAQLREVYMKKAELANLAETWLSFVIACRTAAEQRKRARAGDEGEREKGCFVDLLSDYPFVVASSDRPIKRE